MAEIARLIEGGTFSAADFSEMLRDYHRDGVVREVGGTNPLLVQSAGGLNLSVNVGRAIIRGRWYKNDAPAILAIPANSSGATRLDLVVLRLNEATNTCVLAYVTGASAVVFPNPSRSVGGLWELVLAQVVMPNGAGVPSTITDMRGRGAANALALGTQNWCGFTGPVTNRNVLLSFTLAADTHMGTAMVANSTNAVVSARNFTVTDEESIIIIQWTIHSFCGAGYAGYVSARMTVDAIPYFVGAAFDASGGWINPWAGSGALILSGLAPGVHTLTPHVIAAVTGSPLYQRSGSSPTTEPLHISVMELSDR